MGSETPQDVTGLLRAWSNGDQAALERLIPLVDAELHRIAKRYLEKEHQGQTLQTSSLVNEAYVRLIDVKHADWHDRAHFFAVSARIMRRILVDRARARRSAKHGGGLTVEETAVVLGISADSVKRDWRLAKMWLLRQLSLEQPHVPPTMATG